MVSHGPSPTLLYLGFHQNGHSLANFQPYTGADIIEESKTIFSYNILLIKELDHICANLDTTSPSTSDKMASRMSDRDKFLAFVLFLGFFLIAKNAINSSGANSYILS